MDPAGASRLSDICPRLSARKKKVLHNFIFPHDAYDGHWSMTIDNVHDSLADSVAFDVSMEGKDPGVYEGQAVRHIESGTGSYTDVIHWLDGKDYVITVQRVAG
jgi:hypothetical protein